MARGESSANPVTQEQILQAEQFQPMWKIIFTQFVEHKAAVLGLVVILFYIVIATGAGAIQWATGLNPEQQNPLARYKKPFSTTVAASDQREDVLTLFQNQHSEAALNLVRELKQQTLVSAEGTEAGLAEWASKDLSLIHI